MWQHGKAIALHEDKKIAEEVGDWAGVGETCGNLCRCYAHDGYFEQALTYCNQCYEISREVQLRNAVLAAAHNMGTVLRLTLRGDRRRHAAAEASLVQASDEGLCGAPHTPSSLLQDMNGRAEEAERWLRIALKGGLLGVHLQLAHVAFDAHMLTCGGKLSCCAIAACTCAVLVRKCWRALVCNTQGLRRSEVLQRRMPKMASHIGTEVVSLGTALHKDICGLLKKWRQVAKGREAPDSCTADILAFLRFWMYTHAHTHHGSSSSNWSGACDGGLLLIWGHKVQDGGVGDLLFQKMVLMKHRFQSRGKEKGRVGMEGVRGIL
jgi:hypothetical protein